MTRKNTKNTGRKLKDFVASPSLLIKQYDNTTAQIWGAIWGFTNMSKDKVCREKPMDTIGNRIKVSGRTVERKLPDLINDGWIIDLTPKRLNHAHEFVISEKSFNLLFKDVSKNTGKNEGEGNDSSNSLPVQQSDVASNACDALGVTKCQTEVRQNDAPVRQGDVASNACDALGATECQTEVRQNDAPVRQGDVASNVCDALGATECQTEVRQNDAPRYDNLAVVKEYIKESSKESFNYESSSSSSSDNGKNKKIAGQIIDSEEDDEDVKVQQTDTLNILKKNNQSSVMSKKIPAKWGKSSNKADANEDEVDKSKTFSVSWGEISSQTSGSEKKEEDDDESFVQTEKQKVLALFSAVGIWRETQKELLRSPNPFDLDDVLAVLAWCHNPQSNIEKPAVITAKNLLEGNLPEATCYDATYWDRHIPDAILEHAELMKYVQGKIDDNNYVKRSEKDNYVTEDMKPELVFDGPDKAKQAWSTALGQLQLEMPKAAFDTWVRNLEPAAFKKLEPVPFINLVGEEDGVMKRSIFVLAAMNPFACDWLDTRLNTTISRLVSGTLGQEVSIEFVVKDDYLERLNHDG